MTVVMIIPDSDLGGMGRTGQKMFAFANKVKRGKEVAVRCRLAWRKGWGSKGRV